MTDYLLSVCIPVYNGEKDIPHCLEPLLRMGEDVQIIVCNDGSKDGSLELLRNYQAVHDNICLIDSENAGQSSARNKCLAYATGKYIAFVDVDDYLETAAIGYLRAIDSQYDVDFIQFCVVSDFSFGSYVCEKLYPESRCISDRENHDLFCYIVGYRDGRNLSNKYFGLVSCKFYRRELLNGLSFVSGIVGEDTLYAVQAGLRVKKSFFLSEYLYHYTVSNGTFSHSIIKDIVPKSVKMLTQMARELSIDTCDDEMLTESFYNHVYDKYKWCISALGYYRICDKNYRKAILEEIFSQKVYRDMLEHLNTAYLTEKEASIIQHLKGRDYDTVLNRILYED